MNPHKAAGPLALPQYVELCCQAESTPTHDLLVSMTFLDAAHCLPLASIVVGPSDAGGRIRLEQDRLLEAVAHITSQESGETDPQRSVSTFLQSVSQLVLLHVMSRDACESWDRPSLIPRVHALDRETPEVLAASRIWLRALERAGVRRLRVRHEWRPVQMLPDGRHVLDVWVRKANDGGPADLRPALLTGRSVPLREAYLSLLTDSAQTAADRARHRILHALTHQSDNGDV